MSNWMGIIRISGPASEEDRERMHFAHSKSILENVDDAPNSR